MTEKLEIAKKAAEKILRSYPDYGKIPREFVANMVEALCRFDAPVMAKLADVQRGLPSICKFVPTLADIAEHGRKFEAEYHDRLEREAKYIARQQRIALAGPSLDGPARYSPFPKLTEAFADTPELLKRPFDTLRQASRLLVVEGPSAALAVLQAGRDLGKYNPPLPRFDISDFPEMIE